MNELLQKIESIVRRAAETMLNTHDAPIHEKEGHYNFVTDADIKVQEMLISELGRIMPEAEFFAEEKENQQLGMGYTFIIDPIDGTLNFMHDRRCSAISIGLMHEGQPVLGLIYDPYHDEMYTAIKGEGAYLNGKPICVSKTPFEQGMVGIGTSPYNSELARRTMNIALKFLLESGDLRRMGSAALDFCHVACGRLDVYYELKLSPWDFAAGALIVIEAGGRFEMPGKCPAGEWDFGTPGGILATNQACYERAARIILEN